MSDIKFIEGCCLHTQTHPTKWSTWNCHIMYWLLKATLFLLSVMIAKLSGENCEL